MGINRNVLLVVLLLTMADKSLAQQKKGQGLNINYLPQSSYVSFANGSAVFTIVDGKSVSPIIVSSADWKGVIRAANDLQTDIQKVTGKEPSLKIDATFKKGDIIIGTIGQSPIIDQLVAQKKLDVSEVKGKWESFTIQTIDGNLVIAGSDKRGTIYGIYDLSENIGVSPWHYWADVPAKKHKELYVRNGHYIQPSPKVKYRGIFINDEWPSFGGWATQKFGGINSKMYSTMFELLLRLKANYLWPAMWASAFNEDDPQSPVMADEYGIVMGTSHHEPMMRAHKEYTKRRNEVGDWNYATNKTGLDRFFKEGIERNKAFENIITMGMRGDGDVPMSEGGDEVNMKVLRNVIDGQREILRKVYGKKTAEIPQMWAIFTEVQRYYDAGFKVPDDMMLLFCDNNWGYIRRTGPYNELNRKGGLGMYYHIDMNGGPWNDRWINTTTIPKLREQFSLAYESGIDRLWVVNVGDLKPKELPIDFILRYAWDPHAISEDQTMDYTINWSRKIFGDEYAEEIADIVSKYAKYNLWRKPEVQLTDVMSVVNYHESDRILKLWHDIVVRAEALESKIAPEARDAYYQLVLYPTKASAGVAEIYLAAGKNNVYAKQGRVSANDFLTRAKELFDLDQKLSDRYNNDMSGGKWKNMMQDKHIGYKMWSMPKENELPAMQTVEPLDKATLGVAVEGSELAWPRQTEKLALPTFDPLDNQTYYIDLFNQGKGNVDFQITNKQDWIKVTKASGSFAKETRVEVRIDWEKAPQGKSEAVLEIAQQGGQKVEVKVPVFKSAVPTGNFAFFGSLTGAEFSIPAHLYHANVAGKDAKWTFLPDLGRSVGNMGIIPVTAPSAKVEDAAKLEYKVYLSEMGKVKLAIGILPTQDINPARGLRIAVGLDNNKPVTIDARQGFVDIFNEYTRDNLQRSKVLKALPQRSGLALAGARKHLRNEIFDNVRWLEVELDVDKAGFHSLNVYMVDPEIVVEQIVVNPNNARPSYFGAPVKQHHRK